MSKGSTAKGSAPKRASAKGKQNARQFWKKRAEEGTIGHLTLEGKLVRLTFRFSPERVAAIKSIPKARFDGTSKSWTIPLEHLERLEVSPHFSPELMSYGFERKLLELDEETRTERLREAREAWAANPFAVPERIIALLDLDVVIRLHPTATSPRVKVRYKSPAASSISKIPSASLIPREAAYFVPAAELPALLRELRDRSLTFAVEESSGMRLRESQQLRQALLADPDREVDRHELERAGLLPLVDAVGSMDETGLLELLHAPATMLRTLIPDLVGSRTRKSLSRELSIPQVYDLLKRARAAGITVWLTRRARSLLKDTPAGAASAAGDSHHLFLGVTPPRLGFLVDEHGRGTLVYSDELRRAVEPEVCESEYRPKPFPGQDGFSFLSFEDSTFLEAYDRLTACLSAHAPETTAACRTLIEELRRRGEKLARTRSFLSTTDDELRDLQFSDPTLSAKLFPHQRLAVRWLSETRRAFLGDDMGLGKTLSVLAAFDHLRVKDEVRWLFVVCPTSLVRNWAREVERWLPKRRALILQGDRRQKALALRHFQRGILEAEVLIVNYEAMRLPYVEEPLKEMVRKSPPFLCFDESQRVKNPGAKTFQILAGMTPHAERRVLLSGTPTPRDIADIWAQIYLLDDGERFGANYFEWLRGVAELGNRYSEFAVKGYKPIPVRETIHRVHEILLRRKKEDVMSLPEKTFITRDIELTGEQRKRYEEVRKELILRVSATSGTTYVREIDNLLEEYLRAVQIASNPRLVDAQWEGEPAKFLELDSLVEEIVRERDEKLVVWTNYLGTIRELCDRYKEIGVAPFSGEVSPGDRDITVRRFQTDPTLKILVANPAAGGVGITLTAAQTAVYLDRTWNAEHWLQSIDRIHRIGQTGTVRIICLNACKVDELIARNLERKRRDQAALLGDGLAASGADSPFPSREELLAAVSA